MTRVAAELVPHADSFALPRPGRHGVQGKVLLSRPELLPALLRFDPNSTVDEHPAEHPIDVNCLEGEGFFSVDGEPARLSAGQRVEWPPRRPTVFWTEAGSMLTLMVEHPRAAAHQGRRLRSPIEASLGTSSSISRSGSPPMT